MVVGLTTTELPAALIVGFDGGGTVTEITGNSTGCEGAACCAFWANACPRGKHTKHSTATDTTVRPAQRKPRRMAAI
jgi:hypothetical protein